MRVPLSVLALWSRTVLRFMRANRRMPLQRFYLLFWQGELRKKVLMLVLEPTAYTYQMLLL